MKTCVDNFLKNVGPKIGVSSVLEIFLHFFTPYLISLILEETNRYAASCRTEADDSWLTYKEEIKAFIGFKILMGINRLPHIYDYWSNSPLLHYFPIASRISRHRFMELSQYLHFVDNETLPKRGEEGYNRLGKIQPVIDEVRKMCLENYDPHRENSIDEAMIKFKGRCFMKQYMPLKPTKRGIKVWIHADSHNGYICDFIIYNGKVGNTVEKDLGAEVVLELSETLFGDNYHVYFDNYFTLPKLMLDFLDKRCMHVEHSGGPEYILQAIKDTKEGMLL